MVEGWNKIYRSIQDHWLWTCEPFSRGQAWIDLLLMANHKDAKVMVNGSLEFVERGQRITAIRKLANRWKWSTKKVTHFLDQLVKDNMIEYSTNNSKTLITILNYDKFQGKETPLSIDNTGLGEDVGNTEETEGKHQGNTEETQKKNEGNSEEKQKKTNKNDKEYIKNDKEYIKNEKEWEEGEEYKEKAPPLPPLSFPTNTHKKFYEQWGEDSYMTWFMDAVVIEGEVINISSPYSFKNEILRSKYKEYLEILTGKKVEIGG